MMDSAHPRAKAGSTISHCGVADSANRLLIDQPALGKMSAFFIFGMNIESIMNRVVTNRKKERLRPITITPFPAQRHVPAMQSAIIKQLVRNKSFSNGVY